MKKSENENVFQSKRRKFKQDRMNCSKEEMEIRRQPRQGGQRSGPQQVVDPVVDRGQQRGPVAGRWWHGRGPGRDRRREDKEIDEKEIQEKIRETQAKLAGAGGQR